MSQSQGQPLSRSTSARTRLGDNLSRALTLTSPAFADGARIPDRHTAFGENTSPAFTWNDAPPGTASFAISCEDPDAPSGTFVHWLVWNIDANLRALDEGVLPNDRRVAQGENGFGAVGYSGPKPPPGKPHRYVFRLFALDTRLDLPFGATRTAFEREMEGHVLGEGVLVGMYGR